jgi:hypothetical protein
MQLYLLAFSISKSPFMTLKDWKLLCRDVTTLRNLLHKMEMQCASSFVNGHINTIPLNFFPFSIILQAALVSNIIFYFPGF